MVPGRVPDQLDIGFLDLIEREQFGLNIGGDLAAEMAAGRGERHFYVHAVAGDFDVVDQTEIDDIQRNFGVIAIPELIPNFLFRYDRAGGGHGWLIVHFVA